MKNKIIDCVTFFQENFIFNLRYNILNKYVDHMIVCESKFDHRGKEKNINFEFKKNYDKNKITHLILKKPFPKDNDLWSNQAIQREFILENLEFADKNDYIMFSDPDEIPNPKILINLELKKKYGIFLQKCFNYKLNIFNPYESPWEGTRICKKKNLKSIDYMRQKVVSRNLKYKFYRFDKERNVECFDNGGWHFGYLLTPQQISLKLKTFAHSEFSLEKYSSIDIIKKKIEKKIDLFERNHQYKKIELDSSYPEFILENKNDFEDFILK